MIGLAAWRVTALLSYERGPWDVALRLRERVGFEHDDDGRVVQYPDRNLPRLIACPWCLGVWVTPLIWGLWEVWPTAVMVVAAATILVAVERWCNR